MVAQRNLSPLPPLFLSCQCNRNCHPHCPDISIFSLLLLLLLRPQPQVGSRDVYMIIRVGLATSTPAIAAVLRDPVALLAQGAIKLCAQELRIVDFPLNVTDLVLP